MVTEFETVDKLNDALDALQEGEIGDAIVTLVTLKNKYQRMCEEFDKWADEQAEIEENRLLVEIWRKTRRQDAPGDALRAARRSDYGRKITKSATFLTILRLDNILEIW